MWEWERQSDQGDSPVLLCAFLLRIISLVNKKLPAFSLLLNLAFEVNRHFLEGECGDLSLFSVVSELVINFSM